MSKIKILSPQEAQKIAAGQVVERPANIVKELVENALDAGATVITVSIKQGGKQSIIIVDNGEGMSPDDAQLCFVKHATSKIVSVDQLSHLTTFGFRGEALASIAAVSNITLRTKQDETVSATHIRIQNEKQTVGTSAGNKGTEIIVEDLFYNVPARKKFLKTDSTEYRQIHQLLYAFCFSHLHVHFKFFSDDHLIFNCAPVASLLQRAAQLWPTRTAEQLVPIQQERTDKNIRLEGIISNPQYAAYDRSQIYFLVNNRWVKNQKLTSALLKGYQNVLPYNRFPLACVRITIDPLTIDINIHPRKEEISFMHPVIVEQLITQTVQKGLQQELSSQLKPIKSSPSFAAQTLAPFSSCSRSLPSSQELIMRNYNNTLAHSVTDIDYSALAGHPHKKSDLPVKNILPNTAIIDITPSLTCAPPASTLTNNEITDQHAQLQSVGQANTIIGQYHKTYILIGKEEGLFLIDQHAAHERILYELFTQRFEEVITINLLFPTIITLADNQLPLLEPYFPLLKQNGIDIELFGQDKCIIKSTPVYFKDQSLADLIAQMINWIVENNSIDAAELTKIVTEKLHAQMACKAAVKAGDALTHERMVQLVADLEKTNNSFCCPHGRPTSWLVHLSEIERKFKRKV